MFYNDGELTFSTERFQLPVTIDDNRYTLKEATEEATRIWRNQSASQAKFVDGKLSSVGNVGDSQSLLVSLTLYDSEGKLVPLTLVRSWPSRVVEALFEKAKEIAPTIVGTPTKESMIEQMDKLRRMMEEMDRTEETAKNLPSAITIGST